MKQFRIVATCDIEYDFGDKAHFENTTIGIPEEYRKIYQYEETAKSDAEKLVRELRGRDFKATLSNIKIQSRIITDWEDEKGE